VTALHRILLSLVSIFAAGLCLAQELKTAPSKTVALQQEASSRGVCLLGTDCLNVSKTPVKACLVAKDSKALNGCATDGMKFVGKLAPVERQT